MHRLPVELEAQLRALKRQGAVIAADRNRSMDLVEDMEEAIERAIMRIESLERENLSKDKQLLRNGELRDMLLAKYRAAKARLKELGAI